MRPGTLGACTPQGTPGDAQGCWGAASLQELPAVQMGAFRLLLPHQQLLLGQEEFGSTVPRYTLRLQV